MIREIDGKIHADGEIEIRPRQFSQTDPLLSIRPQLFAIAYRMLGTIADAEDVLQEAYVRWRQVDAEQVRSPESFLKTVVTRLCIDRLRELRTFRQAYIGPWLPEPLSDTCSQPDQRMELAESVTNAFLLVLEKLSPVQRAVFLLHDVFDYDFDRIGAMLDKSPDNCRQLARRARQHLCDHKRRFSPSQDEHQRVAESFLSACQSGDLEGLTSLLAEDAVLYSDGGGKVTAARRPIHGADAIARFLVGVLKKAPAGYSHRFTILNGQPAVVAQLRDRVETTWTMDVADGRVRTLFVMRNPDKLVRIPLADG